jgi:Leucine-rich repeat (LRR) protein
MATFITSKSVGQTINIGVSTSTGYWKYNHNGTTSSVFGSGPQTITVSNANGEFTIIPCLSNGTVSGDLTGLGLKNNQLTSFDGTGLTALTYLNLENNQLTSFDGTDLSALTTLYLANNQLTSFDGTGLTSLTYLDLPDNPLTTFIGGDMGSISSLDFQIWNITTLTTFDGTGLTALTYLDLSINQLTSINIADCDNLRVLYVTNNSAINTPPVNNTLLAKLAANELANDWDTGEFITTGGRYASATADYDYLIANGWDISGVELTFPVTFITSKAVGQTITIFVETSTIYWKYNHDGVDSSVFENGSLGGSQTITVANANGEFTIIPCLSDGTVSGDVTILDFSNSQIISFDGTGLSSLTTLELYGNQLTTFDGTGLTSLTLLNLGNNQLTSFTGTGLSALTYLDLSSNPLTTFIGGDMELITALNFEVDWGITTLETFDGTGLTALTYLNLENNQLTSFDGTDLSALTTLYLANNQLTSFDGTGLTSLEYLNLQINSLTSINLTDLNSLRYFYTVQNLINTALFNDTILAKLAANQLENGWTEGDQSTFVTTGGRTAAGTADYNYLIANGWDVRGANLPVVGTGKLRVKGVGQLNP